MESWSFGSEKITFMVHTDYVYRKFVEDRAWLAMTVLDMWHITQCTKWPCEVLDTR